MVGKKILYKEDARRVLIHGMQIMVEAVSVTLGPKGRNVVLEKGFAAPQIINDGGPLISKHSTRYPILFVTGEVSHFDQVMGLFTAG